MAVPANISVKDGAATERDWAATPLGAKESWPPHLATALNICLYSPVASVLWWGAGHTGVHNDAFKKMFGNIDALGNLATDSFARLQEIFLPYVQKVIDHGESLMVNDIHLPSSAETPFMLAFHPILSPSGKVEGVLATIQPQWHDPVDRRLQDAEQRLRLAVDAASVGTFDWDMQTDDFIYSDRLAQMFGYGEPRGLSHVQLSKGVHPDDLDLYHLAHAEARQSGVLLYELRILRPDQTMRWIRTNGKILFNADGTPGRMYGITIDITEQKEQSAQLEKKVAERTRQLLIQNDEIIHQKQLMDSIIDASVDYICAIDLNEDLLLFNKKYEDVTGYKKEIAVGKNIIAIFPALLTASRSMLDNFRRALKGEAVHTQKSYSPADEKYYENFYIPLRSYSGEVFGAMLLSHDITYRIRSEQELMKANEELMQSNQRLEQFAYVASHDLQEPLRKIQTFSELMHRNNGKKDESEKYYQKVVNAAQRMSALIKDVLAYSKLSDTDVILKEVDLNQIVENVRLDFELLIAEKHATITQDTLPVIKGIPLQLNQLFSNLISNSLKFSNRPPIIRITSAEASDAERVEYPELGRDRQYVKLVFEDNGIGFDQRYANQIFTIFQRLNDRQSYSGTGIGLALCKKIVENHSGFIFAYSEPGKGARFVIFLPSSMS